MEWDLQSSNALEDEDLSRRRSLREGLQFVEDVTRTGKPFLDWLYRM
jgi:hypothetical protein